MRCNKQREKQNYEYSFINKKQGIQWEGFLISVSHLNSNS